MEAVALSTSVLAYDDEDGLLGMLIKLIKLLKMLLFRMSMLIHLNVQSILPQEQKLSQIASTSTRNIR